jgi:hypothetical protein
MGLEISPGQVEQVRGTHPGPSLSPGRPDRSLMIDQPAAGGLRPHGPEEGSGSEENRGTAVFLPYIPGHDPGRQSCSAGVQAD